MKYDKYVKIPWFIILDRNICVGNKLLYGIIMLLSHKEGYCYADNKYLGNYLGVGPRRISSLLKELADRNIKEQTEFIVKNEGGTLGQYKFIQGDFLHEEEESLFEVWEVEVGGG